MNRVTDIQMVPIDQIKENTKNRNIHPQEQIERLKKVIAYQGFRNPLIVSRRSGLLVAGHGRLCAAREMGLQELPVTYQDFEDEAQEYAAGVADNATASWAELDLAGINADIGELGPDFDLELLGIKGFTVDVAEHDPSNVDKYLQASEALERFLGSDVRRLTIYMNPTDFDAATTRMAALAEAHGLKDHRDILFFLLDAHDRATTAR